MHLIRSWAPPHPVPTCFTLVRCPPQLPHTPRPKTSNSQFVTGTRHGFGCYMCTSTLRCDVIRWARRMFTHAPRGAPHSYTSTLAGPDGAPRARAQRRAYHPHALRQLRDVQRRFRRR
eukprot:101343-Chlamydomonas_euryale.AAC.1